ncbi:hypothetical protein GQ53DRAFT_750697 [Thozetella sp. PMI_491]|nr:hypothetical protein GQ53DRAFT_750697 [Thozetella sp. PMI_491]
MMVQASNLVTALLAVFPIAADASKLFCNTGTLAGWDYTKPEHDGTVQEVTNVAYKGGTALKMTQTYDSSYTGRYHSEARHTNGYKRGDELFYGFMFRLSETWEYDSQSYNLAQFISDRVGAGCDDDDWMPSSMLWIQNDQLMSRTVSGHYKQPDCSRNITSTKPLATVPRGVWNKVIIQARWASDTSGFYKIWFNGTKVVEWYNVATTTLDDFEFEFRVGLYANGWHDNKQMIGNQPFRQVWYDEVAIGTTFADVDPDQSSC